MYIYIYIHMYTYVYNYVCLYTCVLRIFKLIPPPSSTLSMSSAMFIMLSAKAIVALAKFRRLKSIMAMAAMGQKCGNFPG